MLRRSSPRALISTRQTLCLPSSDASISAGTSGVSSPVRYTVDFSAITSGSAALALRNDSKLARERVVRVVDEEVAGADRGELLARVEAGERRPRDRDPRIVLQVRPVEPSVSSIASARSNVPAIG